MSNGGSLVVSHARFGWATEAAIFGFYNFTASGDGVLSVSDVEFRDVNSGVDLYRIGFSAVTIESSSFMSVTNTGLGLTETLAVPVVRNNVFDTGGGQRCCYAALRCRRWSCRARNATRSSVSARRGNCIDVVFVGGGGIVVDGGSGRWRSVVADRLGCVWVGGVVGRADRQADEHGFRGWFWWGVDGVGVGWFAGGVHVGSPG